MPHDARSKKGPALLPGLHHGSHHNLFRSPGAPSPDIVNYASVTDGILSPIASALQNRFLGNVRREHRALHQSEQSLNRTTTTMAGNTSPLLPTVLVTDAETPAASSEHNGQRRFSQFYAGLRRFSNSHTVEFVGDARFFWLFCWIGLSVPIIVNAPWFSPIALTVSRNGGSTTCGLPANYTREHFCRWFFPDELFT